ncbi:hypothetical protein ACWGI8_22575, partial [Streptomyces sp. NPDC054841]
MRIRRLTNYGDVFSALAAVRSYWPRMAYRASWNESARAFALCAIGQDSHGRFLSGDWRGLPVLPQGADEPFVTDEMGILQSKDLPLRVLLPGGVSSVPPHEIKGHGAWSALHTTTLRDMGAFTAYVQVGLPTDEEPAGAVWKLRHKKPSGARVTVQATTGQLFAWLVRSRFMAGASASSDSELVLILDGMKPGRLTELVQQEAAVLATLATRRVRVTPADAEPEWFPVPGTIGLRWIPKLDRSLKLLSDMVEQYRTAEGEWTARTAERSQQRLRVYEELVLSERVRATGAAWRATQYLVTGISSLPLVHGAVARLAASVYLDQLLTSVEELPQHVREQLLRQRQDDQELDRSDRTELLRQRMTPPPRRLTQLPSDAYVEAQRKAPSWHIAEPQGGPAPRARLQEGESGLLLDPVRGMVLSSSMAYISGVEAQSRSALAELLGDGALKWPVIEVQVDARGDLVELNLPATGTGAPELVPANLDRIRNWLEAKNLPPGSPVIFTARTPRAAAAYRRMAERIRQVVEPLGHFGYVADPGAGVILRSSVRALAGIESVEDRRISTAALEFTALNGDGPAPWRIIGRGNGGLPPLYGHPDGTLRAYTLPVRSVVSVIEQLGTNEVEHQLITTSEDFAKQLAAVTSVSGPEPGQGTVWLLAGFDRGRPVLPLLTDVRDGVVTTVSRPVGGHETAAWLAAHGATAPRLTQGRLRVVPEALHPHHYPAALSTLRLVAEDRNVVVDLLKPGYRHRVVAGALVIEGPGGTDVGSDTAAWFTIVPEALAKAALTMAAVGSAVLAVSALIDARLRGAPMPPEALLGTVLAALALTAGGLLGEASLALSALGGVSLASMSAEPYELEPVSAGTGPGMAHGEPLLSVPGSDQAVRSGS